VGKRELTLKTFTIDDQNNITVFDTQAEAAATTVRAESQCRGTKGLKSGEVSGHTGNVYTKWKTFITMTSYASCLRLVGETFRGERSARTVLSQSPATLSSLK